MTDKDLEIIIKYLEKVLVPPAEQDAFLTAFERLLVLRKKYLSAA